MKGSRNISYPCMTKILSQADDQSLRTQYVRTDIYIYVKLCPEVVIG